MQSSVIVAPSILTSNFLLLYSSIQMLNNSECDWVHCDVMDGVFVPNISFGLPVLKSIKSASAKPLDVHLMIVQPERYVEAFQDAGADTLTIHYEACTHLHRTLHQIKNLGMRAGVALNPSTPVHLLEDTLDCVDLITIMSVNPGFGGQSFIPQTIEKVKKLKTMLKNAKSSALIEIDGGVSLNNAEDLIDAGADVLVAGNFVFASPNPFGAIRSLKNIALKNF